jgi:hypothetical protein
MRMESLGKQSVSSGDIRAWLNHQSLAHGYDHSRRLSIDKPCVPIGLIIAVKQWLATAAGRRTD